MAQFIGRKGYVAIDEQEYVDAFGDKRGVDAFRARFSARIDGEAYDSFARSTRGLWVPRRENRFVALRTFEKKPPLVVGVGEVAPSPTYQGVMYGSPVVAHLNAGAKALATLRSRMLGACLMPAIKHVAMLAGEWGPKNTDRSVLTKDCKLTLDGPRLPAEIAGEGRRILKGQPHLTAYRDTRLPPRAIAENRSWTMQFAPTITIPTGTGAPLEIKMPVRFGAQVLHQYRDRDLVEYEDDFDLVETEPSEPVASAEPPADGSSWVA